MDLKLTLLKMAADYHLWREDDNIPGVITWLPNGVEIKRRFEALCCATFRSYGYSEIELPFFISTDIYQKQPEHFAGLLPYTYRVEYAGERSFYLKTTSETPFTEFFKFFSDSHQLPFLFFQNTVVFRHEKAALSPPIRAIEINPFIESYTALSDEPNAEAQILVELNIYSHILDALGLIYVISRRPKFDTFPEARFTIAFDAVLPDGTVTQAATVHHLGTSFAQAFDWLVDSRYPTQTSTGISGRAIAATLATYNTCEGLCLPLPLWPTVYSLPDQIRIATPSFSETRKGILRQRIRSLTSLKELHSPEWTVASIPITATDEILLTLRSELPPGAIVLGTALTPSQRALPSIIGGTITKERVHVARSV